MFSITIKRTLVTLAVSAGLLAAAGPASAATTDQAKAAPPTGVTSLDKDLNQHNTLELLYYDGVNGN